MSWGEFFGVALAVTGVAWWLVNGEQKWLQRAQDVWFSKYPAGGIEITWGQAKGTAWRYASGPTGLVVAHPHCLGKVLTCAVCCGFWVSIPVSVVAAAMSGSVWWLLLPWTVAAISSR